MGIAPELEKIIDLQEKQLRRLEEKVKELTREVDYLEAKVQSSERPKPHEFSEWWWNRI